MKTQNLRFDKSKLSYSKRILDIKGSFKMANKNQLFLTVTIAFVLTACAMGIQINEEHFTVYIHSSAENMTTHLNKDVYLEGNNLIVNKSPKFGEVSVYSAFNIHAIDKGTHKISIGSRANGLIEALLCVK